MDYLLYMADGSEALVHYGVKGMHWGEWNEETKERYGYTLPSGTKLKRWASESEGRRGTDLSRPFYATQNESDFDSYIPVLGDLPGTSYHDSSGNARDVLSAISFESVSPVTVATGKQVINELFGMSDFPSDHESRVLLNKRAGEALADPEVRESYRKRGYDAIEDVEDQSHPNPAFAPEKPLLVLSGDKFKQTNVELFNRHRERDYPSW